MSKEVAFDSFIYVRVKDSDKSEEEMIEEAKEKVMSVLEKAGLDCQIFSEEVRDN